MERQRHPLEIPELVALIGSFLPLWKHTSPSRPDYGTFVFQPKTLTACLKVSKLWYKTLLPILWYGYWAGSMDVIVPEAVVGKYSHLFRVLDLVDRSTERRRPSFEGERRRDLSLFMCRNLIELQSHVSIQEGQKRAVKQLVRANPGIKTLVWVGVKGEENECSNAPALDVEDFVGHCTRGGGGGGGGGGSGLESLRLEFWDCTGTGNDSGGRQLREILRTVGGSLKELYLERMYGVGPEVFSASQSWAQGGDEKVEEGLHGASIQLAQVESLGLGYCGEVDLCSAELVKCCPKLKKLQYTANHSNEGIERLAASLEQHCLELESLELNQIMEPRPVETLIRHCRRQLCSLHFSVTSFETVEIDQGQSQQGGQGGLASAILEHAGTLEELCIYKVFGMDAGPFYLQLLIGCSRLKRFTFNLCGASSDDRALLEALRQREWTGCRETLEELEFDVQFRRGGIKATAITRKEMRRMASEMGWEEEKVEEEGRKGAGKDEGERESERSYLSMSEDTFREVLELLRFQDLRALKMLVVERRVFRRML